MKYVIFKRKGMYYPVIMSEQNTHSCVKMEDAEVVSAGFCGFNKRGTLEVDKTRSSESLNIGPGIIDQILLVSTLLNSTASCFIDYDYFDKASK